MIVQTPAGTHQALRDVHTDLLGLDSDPWQHLWDASTPQRAVYPSSGPPPIGLPVSLALGGGEGQFSVERNALRSAPPRHRVDDGYSCL